MFSLKQRSKEPQKKGPVSDRSSSLSDTNACQPPIVAPRHHCVHSWTFECDSISRSRADAPCSKGVGDRVRYADKRPSFEKPLAVCLRHGVRSIGNTQLCINAFQVKLDGGF